jgi:ATP-dependent RNA helicase DDX47/RRP3
LEEYKIEKEEVMVLADRVSEAQRQAITEMKELQEKKGGRGGPKGKRPGGKGFKRGRDQMDQEEG